LRALGLEALNDRDRLTFEPRRLRALGLEALIDSQQHKIIRLPGRSVGPHE
jgi:hypothetical protein